MATAVIGGLILSTMLTLIVIPVTYTIVDDIWHWFLRTVGGKSRTADPGPESPQPELQTAQSGADQGS
jgi:HAE1 family hydrophobic/amphiphilic exporter-1